VIERQFGPEAILVGKAVAFAAMISSEFIFALNEEGSHYVAQTRTMVRELDRAGIRLELHPALRQKLDVWSALGRCEGDIVLPRHLAAAFGTDCLPFAEFGQSWRSVVQHQQRILRTMRSLTSPEDLMDFLGHEQHKGWLDRVCDYVKAHSLLLKVRSRAEMLRHRAITCRERARQLKREAGQLQREKGEYFRRHIRPLQERLAELARQGIESGSGVRLLNARIRRHERDGRAKIERAIQRKLSQARKEEEKQREARAGFRALETGAEARAARATLAAVHHDLEREKLRLVRSALLVMMGLPFTTHRPSAWWIPLVDPSGRWAGACAEGAEFYFEEYR
jgi:hypothetical protein